MSVVRTIRLCIIAAIFEFSSCVQVTLGERGGQLFAMLAWDVVNGLEK